MDKTKDSHNVEMDVSAHPAKMKVIDKNLMNDFIDSLIVNYTVFAPVKKDDIIYFAQIKTGADAVLDYQNSRKAPKEIFFPQSEEMFVYDWGMGRIKSTEEVGTKRILLGIRPCDIKGVLLLDNVFDAPDYKDVYYTNKRTNTIIIGLGCNSPISTCFCTSFDCSPFYNHGSDIFLMDMGDKYAVDIITDKGNEIISKELPDISDEELKLLEEIRHNAFERVGRVGMGGIKEKLDRIFDSQFWDALHEKCLGCGICTYLCPTCHCFDIVDEALDSKGQRVRNWDSCMYPLFTLEASGHNPRPTKKERMRQRIMHKFNYFVENYDEYLCVGCGRCVINCPVNLDIRKVIKEILRQ